MKGASIGIVVIGRNEGQRLIRSLASVADLTKQIVYVDSGSTDGSQNAARLAGAHVVKLDMSRSFTAARARNVGLESLTASSDALEFVQFMDGDCELQPGWLITALAFLRDNPKAAVACGRRRERFPENSIYNRLINQEWETPVGPALTCGGDALMRLDALQEVGGFNPAIIAGEEPELCLRLRAAGWTIWRLDAEMTLHDAALIRFSQWWKRNRRAGHAFAEGAARHGATPERHFVRETRSALFWGVATPVAALLGLMITSWSLVLLLIWPGQIARLALRDGDWQRGFFLTLGKIPEAQGVVDYWWNRLHGTQIGLIEYK